MLVNTLGVDRHQVRPATPLDALIPPERRGEVLARLRGATLPAPALERTIQDWPLCWLTMGIPILLLVPCLLGSWVALLITVPLAFKLGLIAFMVRRTRLVRVPFLPRTVGELVIDLIRFGEYPGYRFSRNEVSLKVRLILAGWLGVPLDQVTEKDTFLDTFG